MYKIHLKLFSHVKLLKSVLICRCVIWLILYMLWSLYYYRLELKIQGVQDLHEKIWVKWHGKKPSLQQYNKTGTKRCEKAYTLISLFIAFRVGRAMFSNQIFHLAIANHAEKTGLKASQKNIGATSWAVRN